MASKSLEVGQRVWIETTEMFFRNANGERDIHEFEVVEANKSSAYIVSVDGLEKYVGDPKKHAYSRRRVEQRTFKVKGNGFGDRYNLWLTRDAFEFNCQYKEKLIAMRKKAHDIVDGMTLADLESFANKFE